MIMIRSANKNRTSPAIKQKRYLLWFLIISLAVGWMATACQTAPEHPAAGDITPSAEATNTYPDTDTADTAPQTTDDTVTQPYDADTLEKIRKRIIEWDYIADFQDGTIYTVYTQVRNNESERRLFRNMLYDIIRSQYIDIIQHIKIGEAVLDIAYVDTEDPNVSTIDKYGIAAVTVRGQTISFEEPIMYPWHNFCIFYFEDVTLVGYGTHSGNWWFINNNGYIADLRENISKYSHEGYVCNYYFDDNNTLCYTRQPRKFMDTVNTLEPWMLIDVCASPDELFLESGTVTFDANGKPVYTVVSKTTFSESDEYESYFNMFQGDVPNYWGDHTLDAYLAHNATIYECVE